ncbi:hypothetical protein [Flammeovirga pacifica]|uniref:hypothetical protein n=1 Tax=Flammeovirga pacifica TaxID=915059 RepID=UPI0011147B17|nr:hypothetical protein [Flammeovirga pacifica]
MKKVIKFFAVAATVFMMSCGTATSTSEEGCCVKANTESCATCEKCSNGDKSDCKMSDETAMHKCCKEKIANGEKACCSKAS